jgi:putative ABC transport system permease protein
MHRLERAPPGSAALQALGNPYAILLPASLAASRSSSVGGSIDIMAQSGVARLDVVGTLASSSGDESAFAVVDLATAQRLFGFDGKVMRLDILVDDGHDIDALAAAMRALLGPAFAVDSSRARESDMQRLVRGYQALLRFVSLITLLAGAMVLGATMSISVREQRQGIGVLRALGAPRMKILVLVLAEAATLAAIAVALGVFGGRLAAELLVGAVSRGLANTYMIPIRPTALQYPLDLALLHAFFAWLVGIAAALTAGARAARMEPVQAIAPAEIRTDLRVPGWLAWLGGTGGALAGYLGIMLVTGLDRDALVWQTANTVVGLVAALVLAPVVVIGGLRLLQGTRIGRGLVNRWLVLRLGLGNVLRAPGRSAWSVLLLSIGLLMFVTADTLHHSLLTSVEGWLDRTVYSDLLVASPGRLFMMEVQPLNEALARDIDAVAGVRVDDGRGAMGIRYATIRFAGREVTVKAFDRPHASFHGIPFDLRSDYPLRRGGDIFASPRPAALVSENFVKHFGKRTGDELTLDSPSGSLQLEIIGVVTDYASPEGVIYLTRDLYRAHWHDPLISVFSVMVQPGVAVARVANEIETTVGGTKGLHATNHQELRQQTRDILNESFAYTHAIEAATLIAAIFGIMNSMITAVLARQREMAVLRALGMSRAALMRMIVCEGLCLAVPAALAAAVLGSLLAYLCLVGMVSAMMGWTLEFHASPWMLGATLALGALCASAASAIAAWKSANVKLSEALITY